MITAADYTDWAHVAGLYVRNISNADRYRAYAEKLSKAGVVTRVVYDFLDTLRHELDRVGLDYAGSPPR